MIAETALLQEIRAQLNELIELVREKPQTHLTVAEFAAKTGKSVSTINRRLHTGEIFREREGIPAQYLAKFRSRQPQTKSTR